MRAESLPLLFLGLVNFASALVVPHAPASCKAPWVSPIVKKIDHLPRHEGAELCSSALGKYVTVHKTVHTCRATVTKTIDDRRTSTITKHATRTVTRHKTVHTDVTVESGVVVDQTDSATVYDTVTLPATDVETSTSLYEVDVDVPVTSYYTEIATEYFIAGTDIITEIVTSDIPATSYMVFDSTDDVTTTVDTYSTDIDTIENVVFSTYIMYTTDIITLTVPETITATTTEDVVVTLPPERVPKYTTFRATATVTSTFSTTVTVPRSTVTSTITDIDDISTTTTVTKTVTFGSDSLAKRDRQEDEFAHYLGIPERSLTKVCSCVATGHASTKKVTKTEYEVCHRTIHEHGLVRVTRTRFDHTSTKTKTRTITRTHTDVEAVTSQYTVLVTSDVDVFDTTTEYDVVREPSTSFIYDFIPVTVTSTTLLPSILTTTTVLTADETITTVIPTTSWIIDVITVTDLIVEYSTVQETSTSEVDLLATVTNTALATTDVTAFQTIVDTVTSTPPPITVDSTTTIRYVLTINTTNKQTIRSGTTTTTTTRSLTVHDTSTVTVTTTKTTNCPNPTQTFALQVASGDNQGEYLSEVVGNVILQNYLLYPQSDIGQAQRFYLKSGQLFDTSGRFFVKTSSNSAQNAILEGTLEALTQGNKALTGCTNTNNQLSCVSGTENSFWLCASSSQDQSNNLQWGVSSSDPYYKNGASSGCQPTVGLTIVPVCLLH